MIKNLQKYPRILFQFVRSLLNNRFLTEYIPYYNTSIHSQDLPLHSLSFIQVHSILQYLNPFSGFTPSFSILRYIPYYNTSIHSQDLPHRSLSFIQVHSILQYLNPFSGFTPSFSILYTGTFHTTIPQSILRIYPFVLYPLGTFHTIQ